MLMNATRSKVERGRGVIEHYREYLPVCESTPIISLGEGDTPLVYSSRLSKRIGRGCDVFVKNEGVNPTCSFKDRGMTLAVSKAMERGASALICASTGNTSASAAAYAARAGISCVVVLPAGKIASGKLLQAFAYGAKIVAIHGNFDDALRIVCELGERGDFIVVNSINPDRIAGQKTAAFEIVDALGDAPDFHLLPLGNAGNITAYWTGYREYKSRQRTCPERQPNRQSGELEASPRGDRRIQRGCRYCFRRRDCRCTNMAGTARRNSCRTGERGGHCWIFQMLRLEGGGVFIQRNSGRKPDRLHRYRTRIERSRCNYAANGKGGAGRGDGK